MPDPATIASITIDPEPAAWAALLNRTLLIQHSRVMRMQLGLPLDRPIIMSGHQPGFWHPGILAKYLAMSEAARAFGAVGSWLVVDQDDHDPTPIRVPVRGEGGRLRSATWQSIDRASGVAKGVPVGAIPACTPLPVLQDVVDGKAATPSVAAGMKRMRELLERYAGEASLAAQFSAAAIDALAPLLPPGAGAIPVLYAMELSKTDLFAWLIDRMIEDPMRCTQAYNDAAGAYPEAGIAPLRIAPGNDASRVELPLWRIDRGSTVEQRPATSVLPTRLRVTANMLGKVPRAELAPRALLMTAMLRLGACDLFIHGTGGGAYDRVTDQWMKNWLGETLAPTAVVTATMYLPLGAEPAKAADAARAQWQAHHARHDPATLGDDAAGRAKSLLLEQIRAEKQRGADTRNTYRELHALLGRARNEHAEQLRALDADAARAKAQLADADVIGDRTWPFPFFETGDLIRLRDELGRQFTAAAVER